VLATGNGRADNRKHFGREGPATLHKAPRFTPNTLTRKVIATVQRHFADHPGSLEHFDWPVTPAQAKAVLDDFLEHRLR